VPRRRNPATGIGEMQFGVGQLPEQEVADALLAAGADEEIGLGRDRPSPGRCEIRFGRSASAFGMRGQACVHRLHDVPAPAVIGGDGQR
jgi:hypothetical protein